MKTKELIRLLQQEDPSGELEVCADGMDIHCVEKLPAYYDGDLRVLIKDETKPFYNIVGMEIRRSGHKIKIHTLDLEDVVIDNPDIPITGEITTRMQEYIDKVRKEAKEND